jgi:hypothetical protein
VSAYGNHSKLSYEAWDLVADGRDSKHRRLTASGELFMRGKHKVPNCIQFDAVTGKWHRDPRATDVGPGEIGAKRAKKSATKVRARGRRAP